MAFCTNCGKPIQDNQKFCASCGMQLRPLTDGANQNAPPVQYPTTAFYIESVKVIISNLAVSKSWGRSDAYTLVVTDRRSIFAKLTQEIMNETIRAARADAAAEGKGFFGKWASQMKGFNNYAVRYNKITPDQILQETPGNFAIENSIIRKIKITDNTDEDSPGVEYGIEFQTVNEKLYFKTMYNHNNNFKLAYGDAIVK
jgi:hypothetical protein